MTTYAITPTNWNDPSFWAGITETGAGHSFDFTALPSNFTVTFTPLSNSLTIDDGTTSFVVQDVGGSGGADATLGGGTLLSYFTDVAGGAGHDSLLGGTGADTLTGGDGRNTLEGGDGDDRLIGNAASGGHTHFVGGAGADTLDGSAGSYDIASYYHATTGVTIDLSDGLPETGGEAAGDVLIGIEQIDGSNTADDFIRTDDSGTQIKGWGGNDTLHGGAGNDRLLGGSGDDSLFGHDGADQLRGGTGADAMDGGADADTFFLDDGFGADTITGGETAGSGTDFDTLDFSALSTSITVDYFGSGTGQFTSGPDTGSFAEIEFMRLTEQADFLTAGADTSGLSAEAGAGNDTLYGGSGADTLSGGTGADEIYGDAGDDSITGGSGNDDLGGDAGRDTIHGEDGDDYLQGMAGDDSVSGGTGRDTLSGGIGDDRLTGGAGDDRFLYAAGDGHDTITDFNFGNSGTLSDGDATNNDAIDLSAFYDSIFELRADQADDGILNQSNTENDYSNNAQFGSGSLTFDGASADSSFFTAENTNVTCFTKGTAILTPTGDRLVEDLRIGDLVCTMDNGPQAIRWIGSQRFGRTMLAAMPRLQPVVLQKGVLGLRRSLRVSQQHGMLLGQDRLIRAKHLAHAPRSGVRIARGCRSVTYIHLLFDAHQIVFAEGAATESFYPGPMIRRMLSASARAQLRRIVPPQFFAGRAPSALPGQVRGFLSGRDARDTLRRTPLRALARPQK